jgi:hypothetical protein
VLARGLTITEISRTLGLERKTVRRYAAAATAEELIDGTRLSRPGLLDPHGHGQNRSGCFSANPNEPSVTRRTSSVCSLPGRSPKSRAIDSYARLLVLPAN